MPDKTKELLKLLHMSRKETMPKYQIKILVLKTIKKVRLGKIRMVTSEFIAGITAILF